MWFFYHYYLLASKRFRKRFAAGRLFKFFLKIPFLSAAYIPNSLTFWLNEKLPRRYLRFEDAECCRLGRRIIVTSRILIIVDFVQRFGINFSDFFFFPRYKDVFASCHPNYAPILTSFVSRLYARLTFNILGRKWDSTGYRRVLGSEGTAPLPIVDFTTSIDTRWRWRWRWLYYQVLCIVRARRST